MRRAPLVLLVLLAACGRTASDMSAMQPGVDVAQAALRGGSPQTALEIAGHVLEKDPANEAALVVQGDALTDLGRVDEARASYTSVLKRNPESVAGEIGLGRLDLADDPATAEALFLEALQHDPRDTKALNDLGVARDLQGNHAGAQSAYRQALGVNPDDPAAEVNLALSMAMSGSADAAVRMLRPLASTPGASRKLQHDLAAALTMAGDREGAAKILSADLSPEQVQQALNAYAAARSGGPPTLVTTPPSGEPAIALASPVEHPREHATANPTAHSGTEVQSGEAAIALAPPAANPPAHPSGTEVQSGVSAIALAPPAEHPPAHPSGAEVQSGGSAIALAYPAEHPPAHPSGTEVQSGVSATALAPPAEHPPAHPSGAEVQSGGSAVALASPAEHPPARPTAHPSGPEVQLAAVPTQDAAHSTWQHLREKMPTLLVDRQPTFIKVDHDGHVFWRVRTGGFSDETQAIVFCHQVQAAGAACVLAWP